jgi:hypothetical protein
MQMTQRAWRTTVFRVNIGTAGLKFGPDSVDDGTPFGQLLRPVMRWHCDSRQ